ncbi:hypothetical protein M405DRAFT_563730 [Rhizopogon salebrosus TDB-379]|nr:hypothetical protein M405DRAFT_563730 [Rhizopogon salebrosus TDB-379]
MENTRCAYSIEYIPKAKIPCMMERRSSNIIILTCDAFGVLDSKADFVLEKRNPRLNRFRNQILNSPIIIRVTHSNHYSRPCHSTSFPSHRSKTFTSWLSSSTHGSRCCGSQACSRRRSSCMRCARECQTGRSSTSNSISFILYCYRVALEWRYT